MSESLGTAVLDLEANRSKLKGDLAGARSDVDQTFTSMGSKAKETGAMLTRTLSVAAGSIAMALKKSFEEYDAGADGLRVSTGKVGKELDGLVDSMKKVGARVTQPLSEVGEVMGDLARRTGLTGKPLEDLTTQVLDLARITGGDAKTSVSDITRLFGDWGIKTSEMTPTLDKLFRASQDTGIGVQELSELMVQFGSPLRNLGLDFETSAAMFAKFEQEGVNIQTVMPGLRQALKKFAESGREPAEALKETFAAMQNAKTESELMSIAFDTFGARAGADLAAAVKEGRFEFDDLIDSMNNGKDTIALATEATNDWSDKFAMFRNKVIGIIGPFGEMGAAIMGGIAAIGPAIFGFGVIAESTFGKVIAGWIKTTAATVANVARQVAAWALLGVQALLHAAKIAVAWLIALGPIAIVAAAVIAIAALIVLNFDKIKRVIGAAWDWVKEKTLAVWNAIKTSTTAVWQNVKEFLSSLWNGLKDSASNIFGNIKEAISGAFNAVKDRVLGVWNAIKSTLVGVWNELRSTASEKFAALRDAVVDRVQAVLEFIKSIPGKIVSALGNLGSLLYNAGRAIITGLLNGIKSALGAVWDEVSSIAGKIADLKGPLPYDMKLLVPNGEALMAGLSAGLAHGFQTEVAPLLAGITATVGQTGGDSYSFSGPLSFPNIRDASQAESFLTNLRQVSRQVVN